MKKKYYKIVSKKKDLYSEIKYDSFDSIFDAIQVYNITPPFKVIGNNKVDYTDEFMSFISMANYKFLSVEDIVKFIPSELQEIMDEYWEEEYQISTDKSVSDCPLSELHVQLIPTEDIKSPDSFMNMWEQGFIPIAYADGGNYLILIKSDRADGRVYIIDADVSSQGLENQLLIGWSSIKAFIDEYNQD